MNDLALKGNWNQVKGMLKERYGQLTDNDLAVAEGRLDQLLGRIQEKTGKTTEQLKEEIEEFTSKLV